MNNPPILYPKAPILIIDDDEGVLQGLAVTLRIAGYQHVDTIIDSPKAMEILGRKNYACILLDLLMPGLSGIELLPRIIGKYPGVPVIVLTALTDISTVVTCMREGAYNYLTKPIQDTQLITSVEKALQAKSLEEENRALKRGLLGKGLKNPDAFGEIITGNSRMKSIFSYMEAIAPTPYTILVTGESGTGKELVARALYKLSGSKGDFVAVNAAGLDGALFSDIFFGHTKGAFTNADTNRKGLIAKAENGFLFLDEIGDLDISSQVKLLRLLQENEYQPLGSDKKLKANTRFIVATNHDLKKTLKSGVFRNDLYHRLNTHSIHIPPLRERLKDLPILIDYFIRKHSTILGARVPRCPPNLSGLLKYHQFPGNVRELENMVADAVASSIGKNMLSMGPFQKAINPIFLENKKIPFAGMESAENPRPAPTLKEVEMSYIKSVLKSTGNNMAMAANILGINYSTLHRKIKAEKDQNLENS